MLLGYERVSEVPELASRLRDDIALWRPLDLSYTAAHEVVASELKFRSLLWAIGHVRNPTSPVWANDSWGRLDSAAKACVRELNDFGAYYENGVYPRHVALGHLHSAIAVPAKALEPVIWSKAAAGSRWGRRILRLGIAAQAYNDHTRVQQRNSLTWRATGSNVVIHPALLVAEDSSGSEDPKGDNRAAVKVRHWPSRMERRRHGAPSSRLSLSLMTMATDFGKVFNRGYGGRRLRLHNEKEQQLTDLLAAAQERVGIRIKEDGAYDELEGGQKLIAMALDSNWALDSDACAIVVLERMLPARTR